MADTKDFQVKSVEKKKLFFYDRQHYRDVGMFSSAPETRREILLSPYIKHPALKEIKFNEIHSLNNYSFQSWVFKFLYSLLMYSKVLKYNVVMYIEQCLHR